MMGKDQELIDAARSGKYNVVEKLLGLRAKRTGPLASLRRGPGPNVQDNSGYSALHHAALNGHKDIVELLLQYEASTNIVDHKGSSPLHLAAWSGNVDVVKLLLSHGPSIPNVNLTNNDDESALHCAAQYGHTDVMNLLLEHNADPTFRNLKNETPLDLAAQYGRLETVELLVRTHPELLKHFMRAKDKSSSASMRFMHTPLHSASRNGHRNVVQVLVESGFDVNTLTASGTALHEAAICGKVEVVRLLLEEGIDISLTDTSGRSVIELLSELNTTITQEISTLIMNNAKVIENCDKEDSNNANSTILSDIILVNGRLRHPVPNTLDVPLTPSTSSEFEPSPVLCGAKSVDSSFVSDYSDTTSLQSTLRGTPTPTQEVDGMSLGSNSSESNTLPPSRFVPAEGEFIWQYQELVPTPTGENERCKGIPDLSTTPSPSGKPTPPKKPPRRSVAPPSPTSQDFTSNPELYLAEGSFDNDSLLKLFERSNQLVDIRPPKQTLSGCVDIYQNGDEEADPPAPDDSACVGDQPKHSGKSGKKKSNRKRFITSAYIKLRASQENLFKRDKLKAVKSDDELEVDRPRKQRESVPRPGSFDFGEVRKEILRASKKMSHPLKHAPLSPTHYQQPPTPDHPPPSAKQAESSIHELIRPLSQELKRLSKDIETETEEDLFTPWDVSSGSLSSGASISDKSVSTDNIEEFAGDTPFAGLYKGSSCYMLENGSEKVKGVERPKSLAKKYDGEPGSLEGEQRGEGPEASDGPRGKKTSRTSEKTQSLSILSPFDEQEEWSKISEIMASYTRGLSKNSIFFCEIERELQARMGRLNHRSTEVGAWLEQLGLPEYEDILVRNGYDDLDFLGGSILEDQDLIEMGVTNNDHRSLILDSVSRLPCGIEALSSHPNPQSVTLEGWLRSINLEQYLETFRKNFYVDMEKVRKMWEVELITVLEITTLGHKKRILVSLGDAPRRPYLENVDLSADLAKLDSEIKELKLETEDDKGPKANTSTLGRPGRHKKSRPAPPPPCLAPTETSETIPLDISIRDPSQLVVGVPSALTTNWRHDPKSLVTSSCDYFAQYLGSTLVKELKGTESTEKSIQKLKKTTCNLSKVPNIILGISYSGVKFMDVSSRDLVCTHLIRNIHCACQDADDLRHFAYITRDHLTGKHYCHVFAVSNMDTATEVILTLGQAFEVAYQIALQGQMRHEKSGHGRSHSMVTKSNGSDSSHIRSLSAHIVPQSKVPNINGDADGLIGNRDSSPSSSSSSVSAKNSSVVESTIHTVPVKQN